MLPTSEVSDTVSVAFGDGAGGFGSHVDFATGDGPSSVAIGEPNVDNRPDLITANSNGNSVSVLRGDGSGGFGAESGLRNRHAPPVGGGRGPERRQPHRRGRRQPGLEHGVGAAELDRNLARGAGELRPQHRLPLQRRFSGGGRRSERRRILDAVVLTSSGVSVLLGDGTGRFGTATAFDAGQSLISLALGDFNGDHTPDVAVGNEVGGPVPATVSVLLGDGAGGFGAPTDYATAALYATSVAVGDLNGDATLDLVVGAPGAGAWSVLLGNGDGTFGTHTDFRHRGLPGGGGGRRSEPRHRGLDVVAAGDEGVSVLLGNGDGTFGAHTEYSAGLNPYAVAAGRSERRRGVSTS